MTQTATPDTPTSDDTPEVWDAVVIGAGPGGLTTGAYLAAVAEGQARGRFDGSYFHREGLTEEAARRIIPETAPLLKNEVLLHGDYCLPNVMLEDWRFSGFIDLDHGGIGDRHIDLFWGAWSLGFNLGTDRWRDRFLDAYGRDIINEELLRAIGAFEAFG